MNGKASRTSGRFWSAEGRRRRAGCGEALPVREFSGAVRVEGRGEPDEARRGPFESAVAPTGPLVEQPLSQGLPHRGVEIRAQRRTAGLQRRHLRRALGEQIFRLPRQSGWV